MALTAKKLYYPLIVPQPALSYFPISLYSTGHPLYQDVFYTVPRAGHLVGGPDHHIAREHFPGHELILCLRGRGYVKLGGDMHSVTPGCFAWINCHQAHEHGAVAEDPWEVLWVRIEGPRLEQISRILAVDTKPVLQGLAMEEGRAIFEEIFQWMQAADAPKLHAAVAKLIALAFSARQNDTAQAAISAPLQRAVEKIRLFYFEPLTVAGLAAHAGMSKSHFARQFKNSFGTGPIDWLRRERMEQAKRRLGDTSDPVQRIAELVGYRDRFFFSKDFKKLTGQTPREFRQAARFSSTPS